MNILLVSADKSNPTDGVIVKGIFNLLDKAYGRYDYKYLFLDDHNPMKIGDVHPYAVFDLIVICGTPWLWDSFQNSTKYRNLKFIFDVHDSSKKLFMGIGTCLNIQDMNSDILKRPAELQGMKELFGNSTVITRDSLSKERLKLAEIDAIKLACPAFYCYNDFDMTSKEHNIIIWCNPLKTISSSNWNDEKKLDRYNNHYIDFNKRYNPIVYCAFENEVESVEKIGLPTPKVLSGYKETMDIMKKADQVLSGRVHCAIPAYSAGCNVGLLSLDTRAFTLNDDDEDPEMITRVKDYDLLKQEEQEYITVLRNL